LARGGEAGGKGRGGHIGQGGVGKTTTSAAIAAGLALRGNKTVVIDFDGACAISIW
jgi:septum site-determining protein MinD